MFRLVVNDGEEVMGKVREGKGRGVFRLVVSDEKEMMGRVREGKGSLRWCNAVVISREGKQALGGRVGVARWYVALSILIPSSFLLFSDMMP